MWDPLRRKEVAETPEERVRQWFIGVLASTGSPMGLMGSEVALSFAGKRLRADIVVYNRAGEPLAIVECKRPQVEITADVARQALLYHGAIPVKFIILTNGNNTYIYKRSGEGFEPLDHLPSYEEML